ncbi:bifunctional phosphoribosylaminoimidazolecarboxamide formyltransferase/IMP cyclohydrolase [bacterium]|nr:bifunctional phosphoribosylaminoimidazolecarboxamide formyltransferase/IMP cyclohydrolase [bacterium]
MTRRALLSVSDKGQLEDVAALLESYDYELIASGGTARFLREHGFACREVSELTGFPEIFGGRVKTLHPVIHGGILAPDLEDFAASDVAELALAPIDVVVVNLYPFEQTLAGGGDEAELVEQIDIGGPAMLRAAAKNFQRVTLLSSPDQYEEFLHECRRHDGVPSRGFRRRCAAAGFARMAAYNQAIATWFAGGTGEAVSRAPLRYGENPHQAATLEITGGDLASVGLAQLGGKELSYNNLVDLIAAVKLVQDVDGPACAIIKHTNPCGLGLGAPREALERALLCDPVSAFGGIFAFNDEVDLATAEQLAGRFLEVVVAPSYADAARQRLGRKKNLRVLTCDMEAFARSTRGRARTWGRVTLRQDEDEGFPELDGWNVVAGGEPSAAVATDLRFAWTACKHGKSNAIVLARDGATLGCGFGQMSRVDSVKLAIRKAGEQGLDLAGSVAASDGFFPFPDGIEALAAAGVQAVIAPGGSIRDDEVAAAAGELGITLVLTGRRHFNH